MTTNETTAEHAAFITQFEAILAIEFETQLELAHARRAAAKNVRHFSDAPHRTSVNDHPGIKIQIQFLSRRSPILDHAMKLHMPTQRQKQPQQKTFKVRSGNR